MPKNPESLNLENQTGFSAEEKEFAEEYSKSTEKHSDDFGFAEKEKREKAALLKDRFNKLAENTPEEVKKYLREELMEEEVKRIEQEENEQIEKEANNLRFFEDRDKYKFFKKSGLISNIDQYITFAKKGVFTGLSADKFKLFIDFYKINTPKKFEEFLCNENNLAVLLRGELEKIEFAMSVLTLDHFRDNMQEQRFKLFLEKGNQSVLKDYLEFNKIKNSGEVQNIFKNESLEYILFSEAKPENSKYIFSNFIKNPEDIKKAFGKNSQIGEMLALGNTENLKYVTTFFQINTLDSLENFCENSMVKEVIQISNLKSLKKIAGFCANADEFKELCQNSNFDISSGLLKTKYENLHYLIENDIINKNNLFFLNDNWINELDSIVNIKDNDAEEIAFLKKIVNEYSSQVVDNTLRALAKNRNNANLSQNGNDIFDVLDSLGNITPSYFDKVTRINKSEKEEFINNTKQKLEKIKKIYEFDEMHIYDFSDLVDFISEISENDFENLCSDAIVEKMKTLNDDLGWNKHEQLRFLVETKTNRFFEMIVKDRIVFSELKGAPSTILFQAMQEREDAASLYGRERDAFVTNISDYAAFGRRDRTPYIGWEYIVAARSEKEKNMGERFANIKEVAKAKAKLEYVKKHLPYELKMRLDKIIEKLDEWRKEGLEIEEKNPGQLTAGAYVRLDDNINIEGSIYNKIDFPAVKYNEFYDRLDKSFKSASWVSIRIGKGIESLYNSLKNNLKYLSFHEKEISDEEKRILQSGSKDYLNYIELIESVYNTPRGVYLSAPPLHGGIRGEDARDWSPHSYALRDRIYYKNIVFGKENYTNVKEYHLAKQRVKEQNDLKIRLYSFSDKPDQKKMGQLGLAIEIERNGKKKFLKKQEAEELLKNLSKYTLPTLYLKNYPLLRIEENK